jgi:histidine triad (HIT) family protein
MADCLFCKIIAGHIPADQVYEDEEFLGFKDIAPKAPVHILVIPKKHIANLEELEGEDAPLMGRLQLVLQKIARDQGLADSGYRIVNNCGRDAGQVVFHIHYHLLGGSSRLNLD